MGVILLLGIIICFVITQKNYKKTSYYKITGKSYFTMRFNKGNYGEYLTYKYLRKHEEGGAKFLFNLYLPRDNGETTEIDVLMISSSGLYVFESKNYSGWIFGNEKGKTWTQTLPQGKKSHKEHFLNPIMQNRLHIKWLNNLLENQEIPVHSIIVFSERCTFKKVEVYSQNIKVIKRDQVYGTVNQINSTVLLSINQAQIDELYDKLYPYTQVSNDDKEKHIQDIRQKHLEKDSQSSSSDVDKVHTEKSGSTSSVEQVEDNNELVPGLEQEQKCMDMTLCPECGAALVLRTAKRGENKGKQFYGCSAFPKCHYIKNL